MRGSRSGNHEVLAAHARARGQVNKIVLEIDVERLRFKNLISTEGRYAGAVGGQRLVCSGAALAVDGFAGWDHTYVDPGLRGQHEDIRRNAVDLHVMLDLGVHDVYTLDVLLEARPHLALVTEEGAGSLDKACKLAAVLLVVVLTGEKCMHDTKVTCSMDGI